MYALVIANPDVFYLWQSYQDVAISKRHILDCHGLKYRPRNDMKASIVRRLLKY
jgi:hypothetical protein